MLQFGSAFDSIFSAFDSIYFISDNIVSTDNIYRLFVWKKVRYDTLPEFYCSKD